MRDNGENHILDAADLHLVVEGLGAGGLGLFSVDSIDELTLVLEDVTLGLQVKGVVAVWKPKSESEKKARVASAKGHLQVTVDLAGFAVLAKETAEDSLSSHPHDLGGHTGLCGTLSLTETGVATLVLSLVEGVDTGAGVALVLAAAEGNESVF